MPEDTGCCLVLVEQLDDHSLKMKVSVFLGPLKHIALCLLVTNTVTLLIQT